MQQSLPVYNYSETVVYLVQSPDHSAISETSTKKKKENLST